MPLADKTKGYIALSITSIVWGTTWIASKIAVLQAPALQVAYMRQFIGGVIFILFFLIYKKLPLPTTKQFRWIFIMSIILFVLANGFSTWGVQYIPSGLGALIGALYPLCVVIIEKVFFKSKKMTALTFVGLLFGILGIALVFYENAFEKNGSNFLLGVSLSVIAMLSWSAGTIFIARNKVEINPYYGIGWQMFFSGIILFFVVKFFMNPLPLNKLTPSFWWAVLYLIIFGSLLAFVAFIYSVKKLPPAINSLFAYINPLVAMLLGNLLLKEKLSSSIFIGSLITVLGIYLVNYSVKKTENTQEKLV